MTSFFTHIKECVYHIEIWRYLRSTYVICPLSYVSLKTDMQCKCKMAFSSVNVYWEMSTHTGLFTSSFHVTYFKIHGSYLQAKKRYTSLMSENKVTHFLHQTPGSVSNHFSSHTCAALMSHGVHLVVGNNILFPNITQRSHNCNCVYATSSGGNHRHTGVSISGGSEIIFAQI